jgi:hypothetical protein
MHAKKRGVESFEKLSSEEKINRKVWVWKCKEREKYENERMKEKKEKRKEDWQEGYERDESSERKKIKCKEGCTLLRDETFTLFPTNCNPTMRTSSMPRSHNFLFPLHMSTNLNLLILDIPTYGLILMIIGFGR